LESGGLGFRSYVPTAAIAAGFRLLLLLDRRRGNQGRVVGRVELLGLQLFDQLFDVCELGCVLVDDAAAVLAELLLVLSGRNSAVDLVRSQDARVGGRSNAAFIGSCVEALAVVRI
jgi:hypothetical protein